MISPKVTIVVSPRERFSYSRESLESLYEHTETPFSLIYVDGNSPSMIQQYLELQAKEKGFQLLRTETYLAPNEARNLALDRVETEYVLFIDNDVVVTPGWLDRLLECATETKASVVCPLTCIGNPLHETIHLAGGEARIVLEQKPGKTKVKRKVHEKHHFVNRPVAEVREQLHRSQCEFAEFHCMLVRTEIFTRIGKLDEALLSTREHIDFCMSVTNAGGTIYCETDSVVTYVPGPLQWSDFSFFMLRWSDAWEVASLEHFRTKWNLTEDKYFKKRYSRLGQRRHQAIVRPFVRKIAFGNRNPLLEKMFISVDRTINRYITSRFDRTGDRKVEVKVLQPERSQVLEAASSVL
ncbi:MULTISPECIES: glycosyltransferase [unclassified Microcoleus]|uniref:glycosyltransferase family 2 protein n=2 Tax=Microcoleus TaxID=44471 RepID=UPI001E196A44|nr:MULTISPECIES: glycosyltransferase [unclassified Microcoleus]TAE69716.1 MAG: glycosyltransferase [Oscillatoriales cyanobacterium]TAG16914.1 MAG: glycosyltransferase [Oscillatoriales cyanobacterium]TAG43961.1 MAG: glycosyltransferase [Oscillatoriales cyanobacterium]TAG59888.1 MAG: glycosyltransferase [Oscillatoriales cyanobacterium]TAG67387.1 MAG: glycosyltransferase [Oscillatoriales cyanobacterium]